VSNLSPSFEGSGGFDLCRAMHENNFEETGGYCDQKLLSYLLSVRACLNGPLNVPLKHKRVSSHMLITDLVNINR
jgi:hypothetical protein